MTIAKAPTIAAPTQSAWDEAKVAIHDVRLSDEWAALRRQIYRRALRMADNAVFDFRLLLSDARNIEMAGRLMWQIIKPFAPQVLVGPGFGAASLLTGTALAALADGTSLSILMVRDKRKAHHQKKWVEGQRQPDGSRAVVIDDFMEGGSALPLVEKALKSDGHVLAIQAIGVFFDMWQPLGSRQISTGRYPVVSLFRRHEIGLSRDCFDAAPPLMKGGCPDFVDQPRWWRYDLNDKTAHPRKCVPVIADDAVFVADDHARVWRHHAGDGAIEWRYDSLADPAKGIVQQLQYADGSLVFGCYDGTVTRLDAASGDIVWRWRQDSSVHATPELDLPRGRLFINTEQWNDGRPFGRLIAMDWRSGRLLWSRDHAWWPPGSPVYDAAQNIVIATCNDQSVLCVDADTGSLRWKRKTQGMVRGKPAVAEGRAYLATEQGRLHCLDLATGETVWQTRYGRPNAHQFTQLRDDVVLTVDGKWHGTAFDAQTGEIRWITRLRSPACWNPVRCGEHWLLLSQGGHLAVFDPVRELKLWEGAIGGRYHQPPAVGTTGYGTLLAAASNNEGLKVFDIHPYYHLRSPTAALLKRPSADLQKEAPA
ncbi:PQQ-binding-like beta-propeller repeat protein [Propionivibrio dicarboxylicus]|uniref:Outer membrane protein assembly factor BamB, contains PQQ-like beta-propeller repeat n=1 Tax=Propionivibrio dicarboxylicus TaxID=83767 RepID=A0A1G7YHY9_9RHOO|nr:PQQ-binding-like beta-propeller repeat protein [Propionivibrio dicarboxylicus]SDG96178.1 Outer membrane protein assembly factor BamB, contains PQQ-like beta-propeller repeat [Propionivibrio dicarboxylicus]